MTRSRDVADTQDNLGGAVAPFVAGKNRIINGGFDIWQRGTSFTSGSIYSADRWYLPAVAGTTTVSRDTDVPTGLVGQYSIKQLTAAGSSYAQWATPLETATIVPLQGRTVVLSWYMKANATWSGNFGANIYYSNSTDARASQTTAVTFTETAAQTPTTSWTRFSGTFVVPSDAQGLLIQFNPAVVQASGASLWMAGVQLELGAVATPFARAGGSIGGELALCQRYYFVGGNAAAGICNSASTSRFSVPFPVTMRVAPTVTAIAAPQALNPTVAETQTGSQTTDFIATASGGLANTVAASKVQFGGFSSMVDGRPSTLLNNALSFSAEL